LPAFLETCIIRIAVQIIIFVQITFRVKYADKAEKFNSNEFVVLVQNPYMSVANTDDRHIDLSNSTTSHRIWIRWRTLIFLPAEWIRIIYLKNKKMLERDLTGLDHAKLHQLHCLTVFVDLHIFLWVNA